jgi:hypothetical protein
MNLEELGRRAVACKHWRWMPGMLVDGIRIDGTCDLIGGLGRPWREEDFREVICDKCVPDLSDPATIGCLIALVEEAWKCPVDMSFAGAHRLDADAEERVYPQDYTVAFAAKTRVDALVLALEAAP